MEKTIYTLEEIKNYKMLSERIMQGPLYNLPPEELFALELLSKKYAGVDIVGILIDHIENKKTLPMCAKSYEKECK